MAEAKNEHKINAPETFSDDAVQKKIVTQASEVITTYDFMMKRALDLGKVDEAFQHAAKFIETLTTSDLTPTNYYAIYHQVSTSLFELNVSIRDVNRFTDRQIAEQYEISQYSFGCLQRLYSMITVSTELVHRKIVRVVDMLEDLTDMVRQAQDPIRALFARHFFLYIWKQELPDSTQPETEKSLNFILNNFAQMNRMWVRIADIMATDSRREQRKELSELIGMNIQRISSLHGISVENYSAIILPFIAKHVELCEDDMAQEFILQSIVQAFPVDFHIQTVDLLFSVFGKVEQGVKILGIANQLLEKFLDFLANEQVDPHLGRQIFVTIAKNIEELFSSEGHLALTDKFVTLENLLRFAIRLNPEDTRNIQNLMKFTNFHIDLAIGDDALTQKDASEKLRLFIDCPLSQFESAEPLYHLEALPILIKRLLPEDRIIIASRICNIYNKSSTRVTNHDQLTFVLSLTASIVQEGKGMSCFYALFHLIDAGSVINTMKIVQELANAMENVTPEASRKAILPIGFIAIQLLHSADQDEVDKLLKFILIYGKSALTKCPQSAIKIFIETARVLDTMEGYEEKVSGLAEEAISTWSELQDPVVKYRIFNYLLMFVVSSPSVDLSVNSQLCTMAAAFTDTMKSVTALTNCASLFWRADERLKQTATVQACLAKASKAAASQENDQAIVLQGLYYVLGCAAYFLAKKVPFEFKWLRALTDIITEKHQLIQSNGQSLETILPKNVRDYYLNTVRFLQSNNLLPEAGDDEDDEGDEGDEEEAAAEAEAEVEADEGEAEADEGDEAEADEVEGEADEGEVEGEADEGEAEVDEGDEGEAEADEGEGEGEADEGEEEE